jgi:hypothetical protein
MANKGEIRNLILEQVDWNPNQSTDFKSKVDRLINRAYQAMSLEAPFLFFEEEARIVTAPDVSNSLTTSAATLTVESTDAYVLKRTYVTATGPDVAWKFDGTWDSRRIEITDSTGKVHRRRIREIWTEVAGGPNTTDRISIDTPWPNLTDADMPYRIFTEAYELPADVVELRSARLWDSTHYALRVATQGMMERGERIDFQGSHGGRPTTIYRGRHVQIDAPTFTPLQIPPAVKTSWAGPDPAGTFEYCFTYAWGKRDAVLQFANGLYEPRWESAPSPTSAVLSAEADAITISLPNIDAVTDFNVSVRAGHSGLYKRIYVRRTAVAGTVGDLGVESSGVFHLLAEVAGNIESYDHDGSAVPDYYKRLKVVHGYQSVRFWPHPDNTYELDLRVLRRPQPLIADTDAPKIHEEAVGALVQSTLVLFYEMNGQLDVSQLASARYAVTLQTLTKRYGNIAALRVRKRPARIGTSGDGSRITYTEDHDLKYV